MSARTRAETGQPALHPVRSDHGPPGIVRSPAAQIRRLYRDTSGFGQSGHPPPGLRRPGRRALVYGEVTAIGARQLIRATGLQSGDCFVDLGSGVGKLVLYVALALPGVRARGIELDSQRSEAAQAVRARAVAEGLISAERCIIEHADVRTADLAGSTVLFANSTCFPRRLLETIARRIAQLQPPPLFATLQSLQRPTARLFDPPTEAPCATSWDRQTTVHLYRRYCERGACPIGS